MSSESEKRHERPARLTIVEIPSVDPVRVAPVDRAEPVSVEGIIVNVSLGSGLFLSFPQRPSSLFMSLGDGVGIDGQSIVVGIRRAVGEVSGVEVVTCERQGQQGRSQYEEVDNCHG